MNDSTMEHGIRIVEVETVNLFSTISILQNREHYDLLLDITAIDHLTRSPRFDVVYHLFSTRDCSRIRITTPTASEVPSLIHLFGSAAYLERELHDMYGVIAKGNPDLRPILLYTGFRGHPLRKDYAIDHEQAIPEGVNPIIPAFRQSDDSGTVVLNMGPSHPATHGTIQIVAELDGETVQRADVHCGYLHRGFEKECERHTYHTIIPYTDRLNYCSGLINNFAYADAVETLASIEITPRCRYARTLLAEVSRLADHLTCVAAALMEMGGMTPFLYLMTIRDYLYEHLNHLTGARLTYSFVRIGGLKNDLTPEWLDRLEDILVFHEDYINRVHTLVDANPIFFDRMRNTGVLSSKMAIDFGMTGPILRSTGLARDIRKDTPYLAYPELDFDIPVGKYGDNFDRYFVRMCEMEESLRIIRQCAKRLPHGPISITDHRIVLPEKKRVYTEIESLIDHTGLIVKGPVIPAGTIYRAHEGANGELGFFIVSPGGNTPSKVHVRSPSFAHMGGFHKMIEGGQLADVIASFGSVNMIGGECDR